MVSHGTDGRTVLWGSKSVVDSVQVSSGLTGAIAQWWSDRPFLIDSGSHATKRERQVWGAAAFEALRPARCPKPPAVLWALRTEQQWVRLIRHARQR